MDILTTALERQQFIKRVQDAVGDYKVHGELADERFAVYIKWFDPLQDETLILAIWPDGWYELGYYSSDYVDGFGTIEEAVALFKAQRDKQIERYRNKILRDRRARLHQAYIEEVSEAFGSHPAG